MATPLDGKLLVEIAKEHGNPGVATRVFNFLVSYANLMCLDDESKSKEIYEETLIEAYIESKRLGGGIRRFRNIGRRSEAVINEYLKRRGIINGDSLNLEGIAKSPEPSQKEFQEQIPKVSINELRSIIIKAQLEERGKYLYELIKQEDLTLSETGRRMGFGRERVRQILLGSGYHSEYLKLRKAKRTEKKSKKDLIKDLIRVLYKIEEQKARERGWAYEKAIESLHSHKYSNRSVPLNNLVEFFIRYEGARKSGIKKPVNALAEGIFKWPHYSSKVLRSVGLEPLVHGRLNRKVTPKEKKDAIKRSLHLRMSSYDVAYFLSIPTHVTSQNQRIYGERKYRPEQFKRVKNIKDLTYRLASQIYEARDLRLNREEIAQLLDAPIRIVDFALTNRNNIETKIVRELKVLYNKRKSNKPYITKEDKL